MDLDLQNGWASEGPNIEQKCKRCGKWSDSMDIESNLYFEIVIVHQC